MSELPDPKKLRHPRHWPSWCYIGILWIAAKLPLALKLMVGRLLGLTLFYLAKERRIVCETNIRLCFSSLDSQQQKKLVRQTFIDNGIGVIETAWAWWCNPAEVEPLIDIEGLEHLQNAQAEGSGVLLVGAHYSTLDMAGPLMHFISEMDVIYRRQKDPVVQYAMMKGRMRFFPNVIERTETRRIVRSLKKGSTVWYAPDQDYGRKHSCFAPFFGINAATITGTTRLARMSGARVILFSHHRTRDNRYQVRFEPIDNFPGSDDVTDATIINRALEKAIRRYPSQYLWVHRRFKTRPEGEAPLYPKKQRKKQRKRNREIYRDDNQRNSGSGHNG